MPDLINVAAFVQSVITILFGAGLTYYVTRYWKSWEARRKAQDEAAAAMKTRNEKADAERHDLMLDSAANKEQHTRFQLGYEEARELIRTMSERQHKTEVDLATLTALNEAAKQSLARIDGQLTLLIDKLTAHT